MTLNVKSIKGFIQYGAMLLLSLFFLIMITTNSIYAEGSKELAPDSTDRLYLYLNGDLYNNFGRYDGNADQRLFVHIANPDQEQVFLGFSQAVSSGHYPCSGSQILSFFRIKDPNGNIVFPTANDPNGQVLDSTTANIRTRTQLENGPAPIGGVNGYQPFVFDPSGLPAGDYYVEFSAIQAIPSPGIITAIENWDITVASKTANPQAIDGRVFSINWSFYAPSIECDPNTTYGWFDRPFNGQIHVLSKEGFVNKVDFKGAGFQPAAFNLFFNETGTANTGDPITDRRSVSGLRTGIAQQKIFLNNPDPIIYPSGEYGTLLNPPELLACHEESGACIQIEATKPGQVEILIDLEKNQGDFVYNPDSRDVILVYNIIPDENEEAPYERCIPWDGIDGKGNHIEIDTSYDMLVTYNQGVYHLPVYDVEFLIEGITTTNVRPIPPSGVAVRKLYYDDSNIPHLPGNGASKIELNGCQAPCHNWTNKAYGDINTINTWFFADEETKVENEAPNCVIDAIDDERITPFETPISIAVLSNDIGNLIDNQSVSIFSPTVNGGTINISNNGTILYTPPMDFIGIDSFQYSVCYDIIPKNHLCDIATVLIKVGDETETNCEDGIDNDNDGLIDCDDPDCLPKGPALINRKRKK